MGREAVNVSPGEDPVEGSSSHSGPNTTPPPSSTVKHVKIKKSAISLPAMREEGEVRNDEEVRGP